ncbi:MAG: methylmalonyl-CoA epimerase [Flavobacteriales bacterium]|nr:methylmalonyl-CoA epimerase [Flavobacteriales bacterium]
MMKLDHIGIAVKNLEEANVLYAEIMGEGPYKQELVAGENVVTSFFTAGESKIELLVSTDPEGPIAKFIDKKGEGIHHIAFEVDDIEERIAHFEAKGFRLLNKEPKKGADNKLIAFLHPKDTGRVLIELCQDIKS